MRYSLCRVAYLSALFDTVSGLIMVHRSGGRIEYTLTCVSKGCFSSLKEIKSKINTGHSIQYFFSSIFDYTATEGQIRCMYQEKRIDCNYFIFSLKCIDTSSFKFIIFYGFKTNHTSVYCL